MDKAAFLDKYLVDRRDTNSLKWDTLNEKFGTDQLISMWIADTEFKTCERITDAMKARIDHGAFGYSAVPDSYFEAYSHWMASRYHFPIKKEWVRFSTGVVTAIAWAINAFTEPGEACMILSPVYYPFFDVIKKNGRKLVAVDLDYEDGHFSMNYDRIEQAIEDDHVKLFVQCSPHNPAGRVWTETELERILGLCRKHHVLVVSDEIHQDLALFGHQFIPAAAVHGGDYQDMVITLSSGSKTFNLASLLHSHIVIPNAKLRARYDRYAAGINRTETNLMGIVATEAGYRYGGDWLAHVLAIVEDNYRTLAETIATHAPKITLCPLEGTYLAFMDLSAYVQPEQLRTFIVDRCHLAVDYGDQFGSKYAGFIRLNLATDPELVKQATENLVQACTGRVLMPMG